MGWFDDARNKASAKVEETRDAAADKAADKATAAALAAAGAAVSRSVGGLLEGVVSSAESALAEAEANAGGRRAPQVEPSAAEAHVHTALTDDTGDTLGRRMREAAEPVQRVAAPAPRPARHHDPLEDARRALARSREARGLPAHDPVEERRSSDPVTAALEAAAEARAHASSGSARNRAREESAREQLAAMKASVGRAEPPDDDDGSTPPSGAKKRTL